MSICALSTTAHLLVALAVVEQMGHDWRDDIEPPRVVCGEGVDRSVYRETWGFVPHVVVNHYHWPSNTILLMDAAGLDSLAHEYAHWVQFAYVGHDLTTDSGDFLESQAVHVQNWWRH